MPNGEYTVTLKLAETYFSSAGRRVFNVAAEGVTALQDFDPFAAAGGKNIAVDRTFVVTVNDGVLNLQFSSVVDNPEVRGIRVVRSVAAPQASYRYRGDGLRGSKTEGGSTATYTWDLNAGLPVVLQDGANTYVYGLSLISQTDGSGSQSYFLGDGLGSTRALTDASGNVVATYGYDVFGAVRSSTGTGSTEYRFTGQQDDAILGYTYLRARYYDPATGRFISRDPFRGIAADPATLHPYVYAHNSPTNLTDPSGECDAACMAQVLRTAGPVAPILAGGAVLTVGTGAVVVIGGLLIIGGAVVLWNHLNDQAKDSPAREALCAGEAAVGGPAPGLTPTPPAGGPAYPDPKFAQQLERQMAKSGPRSIVRSLRSLENELAKHEAKLPTLKHPSSVEREIRTLTRQIETVRRFMSENGISSP